MSTEKLITDQVCCRCCKMMKSQKKQRKQYVFFPVFNRLCLVYFLTLYLHILYCLCACISLNFSISVSVCLSQVTLNSLTSWTIKQRGVSLTHVLPTVAETQSGHKNHFTGCEGPPPHDHGTLQNHEPHTPLA